MKRIKCFLLFLLLLIYSSCNKKRIVNEYYISGEIKMTGEQIYSLKENTWVLKYKNGKIHGIGNYKHGKLNGEWIFWDKNGKLMERGFYFENQKFGKWYKYKSGILMEEIDYYNNLPHGFVKIYSNKKIEVLKFINGKSLDYTGDYLIEYNHFQDIFEINGIGTDGNGTN